ncbi:cytochrome P450 [Amycolatopsis sp. OK19-0408]|uniref:Cytochrome P450 n=1 Tax=Amycolatopsis iheyensis TaxID=2945988 RepID=A0A9X2SPQ6_9PSEU|nr:cytochrome P450 [Amycolatopsis iheyensis]MCR6488426.1 cytochrome P450 [Amycolatopsis iheyensis]
MPLPRESTAIDDIPLSDMSFWQAPVAERDAAFARLRALPGLAFFPEPVQHVVPMGPGYHAVVRHADVVEVSRRPADFTSAPIATALENPDPGYAHYFDSLINFDGPRHAKMRRVVNRAFTHRAVQRLVSGVRATAAGIVDELAERGPSDFVEHVAARLPLTVICDLIGIPERERATVNRLSTLFVCAADPEYTPGGPQAWAAEVLQACGTLQQLVLDLCEHRQRRPADDLVTALSTANVDGERLTASEVGSFFILLVLAGNETTRNALAHALRLLTEHPAQKALLTADLDGRLGPAVEEILRYAPPINWMRRTVARPGVALGGLRFEEGEKLLLFYWSANRDETVFAEPQRFDITRDTRQSVTFGGWGPHYCLGAHLARHEITVLLGELLRRLPGIRAAGPPDRLVAGFVNGVKRLPCEF